MSQVVVTLGGVAFEEFEVPEALPFGGSQMLAVKKLIGGQRSIDAMGDDDVPIEWSGRFRGANAVTRAKALDAKRKAGKALRLTWAEFAYDVVIQDFFPVYMRGGLEIPYRIVCVVISTPDADTGPDAHQMILADAATASALGAKIGDGKLSGLLGGLDGAIGKVSDFAKASQATINSVLDPIRAVQGRVSTLIASAENTLLSVTTLGGVLPNNPLAKIAQPLVRQVSAMRQVTDLYDLGFTTDRMAANLGAIGAGGAEVVTAGGDLYRLAAKTYGDAGEWPTIAKANGLTDPMLSGIHKLLIPPAKTGADGLLGGT